MKRIRIHLMLAGLLLGAACTPTDQHGEHKLVYTLVDKVPCLAPVDKDDIPTGYKDKFEVIQSGPYTGKYAPANWTRITKGAECLDKYVPDLFHRSASTYLQNSGN